MKIITKKVTGGFIGMVVPDEIEDAKCLHMINRKSRWRGRSALGVYPTRDKARAAAALMIELNPESFDLEGDSARVSNLADIDAVRGKKAGRKC